MQHYGSSQPPGRFEDRRFVTGRGCYLDDLKPSGTAVAAVLRSPHANALIKSFDAGRARQAPGVLAVYSGADWRQSGLGPIPTRTPARNPDGSVPYCPPRPALVADQVRYVGDPVALLVAEDEASAQAALELIEVDYRPQPAVVDPLAALGAEAPQVWPEVAGNLCLPFSAGDRQAVQQALAAADHVVTLKLVNQRVTAVAMEPRAALGEYDPAADRYTLTATTQNIHAHRQQIAELVLGIDPARLRLRAVDIGGGFGVKNALYPEYVLVLWAARQLGRPVKWTASRSDSFSADTHGREQHSEVRLGLSDDGDFLALEVRSVGNTGAYMATVGPFVSSGGSARTQGGPYRLPAVHFSSRVAFTHTSPTDPYRGAGRPEASYVIERVIDVAARQLGFDPLELRRRNALRRDDLPYRTAMGAEIDSGDFPQLLTRAEALSDRAGFAERAAESRRRGRLRGLGYALYFECTGGAPKEYAALSFDADGRATLAVGSHSTGTGHETVLTRMVGERLGLDPETVRFVQADTDATPIGGGHGGSRCLEIGGVAVAQAAAKVADKASRLAAELLEAAPADIELAAGRAQVAGTDRGLDFVELLRVAVRRGLSLDDHAVFERQKITFPAGCHSAEVEIDPDTGKLTLLNYVAVDDFGTVINPQLADGQVMGGAAQGIGQALLEQVVYQDDGQLMTGSLMDYGLPRADDLPGFSIEYLDDTPTANNPLGVKGAGEAGCVGALAAVVNAAVDALAGHGVSHIDMPLTPQRLWRALQTRG